MAVLAALAAGCGVVAGTAPRSASAEYQTGAVAKESSIGTAEYVDGGPLPLVTAQPPGLIVVPWQVARADALTRQVYLTVTGVGCSVPKAVRVQEQLDKITITAYGTGPIEPCTGKMVALYGYVATAAPIAGRRVIHGR